MSEKVKKPFYKKWWVWVGAIVVLMAIGISKQGGTTTTGSSAIVDPVSGNIVEFREGDFKKPMYFYFHKGKMSFVHYERETIVGNVAVYKRDGVESGRYDFGSTRNGFYVAMKCQLGPDTLLIDTTGGGKSFLLPNGNAQNLNRILTAFEVRKVGTEADAYHVTPSAPQIQWR